MRCFVIVLLSLYTFSLGAQVNVPPKAAKAREEGRALLRKQQQDKALKAFDRAIALYPDYYEAIADRAALQLERDPAAAEADLLRLTKLRPEKDASVWLALARLCAKDQRFENALDHYSSYLNLIGEEHRMHARVSRERADVAFQASALMHPVPFEPRPLPPAINEAGSSQYGPILSADGNYLVFTRRLGGQEDFYYSVRTDDEWAVARPLADLNTPENEGMHSLSRDGRTMIFTWCHDRQGLGSCDLYSTTRMNRQDWSKPRNLGPLVNSRHWDAQPTLSADGRTLIFTSNREGGAGESDLWWSHLDSLGEWTRPSPLPGKVNTPGREQSPFLHADGITLYFASNGHPGMGDFDLYVSRYEPDSGWTLPVNLGYPINTDGHEGALSVEMDGQTAWFATDRYLRSRGERGLQLYTFTLPERVRGTPVTFVEGHIRDALTGRGLPAKLQLHALTGTTGKMLSIRADAEGRYLVCLPAGTDYALQMDHPGYSFHSEKFSLSAADAFRPYRLDVRLEPLSGQQEEVRIVLRNVHFPLGSDRFLTGSEVDLERILRLLNEHPDLRIRLEGHTDATGSPADNLALSLRRARAVQDWLLERGIAQTRMECQGYGQERPIADNDLPDGRQLNRRTEMVILR
jgi:outer membrane protein OmpA-like peptidoglycan-associated protein